MPNNLLPYKLLRLIICIKERTFHTRLFYSPTVICRPQFITITLFVYDYYNDHHNHHHPHHQRKPQLNVAKSRVNSSLYFPLSIWTRETKGVNPTLPMPFLLLIVSFHCIFPHVYMHKCSYKFLTFYSLKFYKFYILWYYYLSHG